MRKLSVILATVAVMVSTFGGVAAASGGGNYPPRPVTITVQTPTVPVGVGFWAKGQGLCVDTPARFIIASIGNPSLPEYWTPFVPVGADGTAMYTFTPEELAPFGTGPISVAVKQSSATCFSRASTIVTISNKPVKSPSIDVTPTSPKLGQDLKVQAKNFCPDTKIQFILRSLSTGVSVTIDSMTDKNGSASATFPASVLPGGAGNYDVWAKQKGACDLVKTVAITVSDSKQPGPKADEKAEPKADEKSDEAASDEPTTEDSTEESTDEVIVAAPRDDNDDSETNGNSAQPETESAAAGAPAAAVGSSSSTTVSGTFKPATPATITPVVLSAGLTAPASASAASPAASTPSSAQVASAAAAAAAPGDTLPVTGSEPSRTLQIALTALLAGIGMIIVTSVRRRTANVRPR